MPQDVQLQRRPRWLPWLLISAGLFMVIRQLAWASPGLVYLVYRFWPLLLMIVGLELVVAQWRKGLGLLIGLVGSVVLVSSLNAAGAVKLQPTPTIEQIDELRTDTQPAALTIETNAAELILQPLPTTSDRLVLGTFSAIDAELARDHDRDDELTSLSFEGSGSRWLGFDLPPTTWNLQLSPLTPLDLAIDAPASALNLNLQPLLINTLTLEAPASTGVIWLPAHGTPRITIEAHAASLELVVPEGTAARISADLANSRVIDSPRFIQQEMVYTTPGWDTASERLEIFLAGNGATITLR